MNISEKFLPTQNGSGHPFVYPGYMTLYKWEGEQFNYSGWHSWMRSNWNVSFLLATGYLAVIAAGRHFMKDREPYRLKVPLVLWNVVLAAFSTVAFARTVPELVHLMRKPDGLHESICIRDDMNIATVFWALAMTLSKAVELGDTVFIVLRKQPLIVLHWFHHATVLLYSWYTYADHDAAHRWFMTINALIHSIMYSYYSLRALGIKLPKHFAMAITFSQLIQMFYGIGVNVYALYAKHSGMECQTKTFNVAIALLMYASYAVLFSNFFNKSYFQKKKKFD